MIHHISIAVRNPIHVANVLAEIMGAQTVPAPLNFPKDSRFIFPGDEYGTLVEVLPYGTELRPDEPQAEFHTDVEPNSSFTATHAYISIDLDCEQLLRIGEREGWLARRCDRGPFELVEFWIENRLMIEFSTPEMTDQYITFLNDPEVIRAAMEANSSGLQSQTT